jgi:toxin ParE1/3/4
LRDFPVFFRPRARKDLIGIYRFIAKHSSLTIAGNYINRIEKLCMSLASLPERGTVVPGRIDRLRTIGFERRATILFQVGEERVEILRVLYGGRDLGLHVPRPSET